VVLFTHLSIVSLVFGVTTMVTASVDFGTNSRGDSVAWYQDQSPYGYALSLPQAQIRTGKSSGFAAITKPELSRSNPIGRLLRESAKHRNVPGLADQALIRAHSDRNQAI
jgi:hypothetical protein